jgi:hypothetical protein
MAQRARPETYEHRPSTVFIGPCAWVPGSRALPTPRNDDHLELFHTLSGVSALVETFYDREHFIRAAAMD